MRSVIAFILGATLLPGFAAAACEEEQVKADLMWQSQLAYAQMLQAAARTGHVYSAQDIANGARRHAAEFVARQYVAPLYTSSTK